MSAEGFSPAAARTFYAYHTLPATADSHTATAATRPHSSLARRLAHPLTLLLLAFAANALLWAMVVPPGNAPDEWAHFDYIRHIALHGALPIYGQTTHISNPAVLNSEAILPPLYYLLATPLQIALGGYAVTWQMLGLRAFSALLSTITVALVYLLGRALAPNRPEFALTCAALVGFNPMFSFISAAINSDNLINLIYAALLLTLYHGTRQPQPSRRWLIGLGALLGAGLITKPSIVAGGVASGVFLIGLAWQQRGRRLGALLAYAGWAGGAALLVSGWMLVRNWLLYHDPTGVLLIGNTPNAYVTHPYSKIGPLWDMLFSERPYYIAFFPSLFHGFWGVFDFYIIWLAPRIYATLDWLLLGGARRGADAMADLARPPKRRATAAHARGDQHADRGAGAVAANQRRVPDRLPAAGALSIPDPGAADHRHCGRLGIFSQCAEAAPDGNPAAGCATAGDQYAGAVHSCSTRLPRC